MSKQMELSRDASFQKPFIFPSHACLLNLNDQGWARLTGKFKRFEKHETGLIRNLRTGCFYRLDDKSGEVERIRSESHQLLDNFPCRKAMALERPERWKYVDGYPGFIVSTYGRVVNTKTMHVMKNICHEGYFCVRLGDVRLGECDRREIRKSVHTLVALAFLGERPTPAHTPNHLNSIRSDNRLSNLEWASPRRQYIHSKASATERMLTLQIKVSSTINDHFEIYDSSAQTAAVYEVSEDIIRSRCKTGEIVAGELFEYFKGYVPLPSSAETFSTIELEAEVWKNIPPEHTGGKTGYQISSLGRMKGIKGGLMRPFRTTKGYILFRTKTLTGSSKNLRAHRLVAMTFLNNPSGHKVVDHVDEDPSNNRLCNLQWTTHMHNTQKSVARPIDQFDLNGNFLKRWSCSRQITRELGFTRVIITGACIVRQIKSYGFVWRYTSEKPLSKRKSLNDERPRKRAKMINGNLDAPVYVLDSIPLEWPSELL